MAHYVDKPLDTLGTKPFAGLILRSGKQTGIVVECSEQTLMTIRGLEPSFPPYVQFKSNDVYASFDGDKFTLWKEGYDLGVQMFRMLDPRIYRDKIIYETLAWVSPTRSIARCKYKMTDVTSLLKLPKEVSVRLLEAAGKERDIVFDIESGRVHTVSQRDIPPVDDEVSLIIFQDT